MLIVSTFDQRFLVTRCFRLQAPVTTADLDKLATLRAAGPLFADAKLPASDLASARQLLHAGFRKICIHAELEHDLSALSDRDGIGGVIFVDRLQLSQTDIRAHAANFVMSRYRQDPLLNVDYGISLYTQWVTNSLSGFKQVAHIERDFCTFSDMNDTRSIDLLSVLDKQKGHAKLMLKALLHDAHKKSLSKVRVTTEVENSAALASYLGVGFKYHRFYACFHLHS